MCAIVVKCATVCAMIERAREHIAVRLSPNGIARVRELAAHETEGNVSQMIRKLLGEALAARGPTTKTKGKP